MDKGKIIFIVGQRGSGKSTVLKNFIRNVPNKNSLFIFDKQQEHKEYYDKPIIPFKKFAEETTKMKNRVIVFEEATIFLGHFKNFDMLDLLVSSRHTKNTIFLVFHSLRALPRYIYDLGNYIILFKTMDQEDLVRSRFEDPALINAYLEVQKDENPHAHKIIKYA